MYRRGAKKTEVWFSGRERTRKREEKESVGWNGKRREWIEKKEMIYEIAK